jgi:hypothetical protein
MRRSVLLLLTLFVGCSSPDRGDEAFDVNAALAADPRLGTWMERPAPSSSPPPSAAPRAAFRSAPAAGADARLRAKLAATRLPGLAFPEPPDLVEAAEVIGRLAGVDVVVRPDAADAAEGADALAALGRQQSISAVAALDLLCELAGEGVAWTTRHGLVLVTTPEDARPEPRLLMIPVADLVHPVRSAPAREMGVFPSGFEPELELEEGSEFGVVDPDTLIELIRDSVAPGTWDEEGVSIEIVNGVLIVRY